MLRILVIVFLLLVVYRLVKARSYKNARQRFAALEQRDHTQAEIMVDSVCGKEIARKDAHLLWQDGEVFGFCSQECLRKFQHGKYANWKM